MSGDKQTPTGLEGVLSGAVALIRHLPPLRSAFERAAEACASGLSRDGLLEIEIVIGDMDTGALGDPIEEGERDALFAVLNVDAWSAQMLAVVDREFVFLVVDLLLGADGSQPVFAETREFSAIEKAMAGVFLSRFAMGMQGVFSHDEVLKIQVDEVADVPAKNALGSASMMVVRMDLDLCAFDRSARATLVLPQDMVGTMREAFVRSEAARAADPDADWNTGMQNSLIRTQVSLSAVLDEIDLQLGEIERLQVGQMLNLSASPSSLVKVECEGHALLNCHLGQADGAYNLRVEDVAGV